MLSISPLVNTCQVFYITIVLHFCSEFYLFYQSFYENHFENFRISLHSLP